MNFSAKDFGKRARQAGWERELAKDLRRLSEAERLSFLLDLLSENSSLALDLARKCLTDRKSFEIILERGLQDADASSIRYWLGCVIPPLGFPRVVRHLGRLASTYPIGVRKASYGLPTFSKEPGYLRATFEMESLSKL